MGLCRGAVFHHGGVSGVPENSQRITSLHGPFPLSAGTALGKNGSTLSRLIAKTLFESPISPNRHVAELISVGQHREIPPPLYFCGILIVTVTWSPSWRRPSVVLALAP